MLAFVMRVYAQKCGVLPSIIDYRHHISIRSLRHHLPRHFTIIILPIIIVTASHVIVCLSL